MVIISGSYGKLKRWVKARIATHKADSSAHHAKYLDSEAVVAVGNADDYVKNTGDTITGRLIITSAIPQLTYRYNDWVGTQYQKANGSIVASFEVKPTSANPVLSYWSHFTGSWEEVMGMEMNIPYDIDFKTHRIKNPKNHAASALSGTKKLVEINIGGTPYYFEVYPTKA